MPEYANEQTGWMIVKVPQILWHWGDNRPDSWEMYTGLVYGAASTLMSMYGDGDPDITQPGTCKVYFQCNWLTAQTLAADANCQQIFSPWQPDEEGVFASGIRFWHDQLSRLAAWAKNDKRVAIHTDTRNARTVYSRG